MRGNKECSFSGLTNYSRVWRQVPESETWSVGSNLRLLIYSFRRTRWALSGARRCLRDRMRSNSIIGGPEMSLVASAVLMPTKINNRGKVSRVEVRVVCKLRLSVTWWSAVGLNYLYYHSRVTEVHVTVTVTVEWVNRCYSYSHSRVTEVNVTVTVTTDWLRSKLKSPVLSQ